MNGTGKGRESQILQIQIADAVLAGDPIDEDAVAARCRALYKLGHKGMAKETYDRFCAAFRGLLDAEPSLSWREITLS